MIDEQILEWAMQRGLLHNDYRYIQLAKTVEELGELANSMILQNKEKMQDALVCFVGKFKNGILYAVWDGGDKNTIRYIHNKN